MGKAALRCAAEPARSEWAELRREALKGLLVPPFPALEVPRVSLAAGESVLVVGARGGIGSAVVLELLQQGAVVRAFTRDPELVAKALAEAAALATAPPPWKPSMSVVSKVLDGVENASSTKGTDTRFL